MQLIRLIAATLCVLFPGNFLVQATVDAEIFMAERGEPQEFAELFTSSNYTLSLENPDEFDVIFLSSGKNVECEIVRISEKFVFYTQLGSSEMEWVDRRLVKQVKYKNGEIDKLEKKATPKAKQADWKTVTVTRNPEDVANMRKVGDIKVKHKALTREHYYKPYTLESSAEILVRRDAAQINADVALVLKVEHHRPYGDPPTVTIFAEAYR